MLLSAATTEDKEKTEPVIWVLVRSRPYFVRVRRRDITVTEDSAVVHRAYFERFATGVECYLNGDWVWAREYLVWCYAQNPADRPAVVLLEYMAAKRFAAPKGWLGCRRDDYEDDADALRV